MRVAAASTLGQIGHTKALGRLSEMLSDQAAANISDFIYPKYSRVCDAAAAALDAIGTPKAKAVLDNWRKLQSPEQALIEP